MAYDEHLAQRVRATLGGLAHFDEIKMFGGLCFTVGGHMCCGVMKDELMLRVGPQAYDEVLGRDHARIMDFTGRPMKGMVIVEPAGLTGDAALRSWLHGALTFTQALPPKPKGKGKKNVPAKPKTVAASIAKADAGEAASAFAGFDKKTFRYLASLGRNNTKAWFEAHREDYEALYLAPALAFVDAVGPKLQRLSKTINYRPKVNGSLFRIHRDVRFSKDKAPYRDHIDLWFWAGADKGWSTPGFFMRVAAKTIIAGAGMHRFPKEQTDAFRRAVADGKAGAALARHLAAAEADGFTVALPTRKRMPRGYDPDHPRASLLRHDGLTVKWEGPVPDEAYSSAFVGWYERRCRALLPIHRWLLKHVVPVD